MKRFLASSMMILGLISANIQAHAEPITIRIGHFPNITHAHGVIAH